MLILVAYDVSTESAGGRRRLRRVAKVCQDYGQRVQKSIFECRVDQATYETLERRLIKEINKEEDNLRFYRLMEPVERYLKEYGKFRAVDFEAPLIL